MFAAGVLLHGVIGVSAEPAGTDHCFIEEGANLLILGSRGTETRELMGYQDDIVNGYQEQQTKVQG